MLLTCVGIVLSTFHMLILPIFATTPPLSHKGGWLGSTKKSSSFPHGTRPGSRLCSSPLRHAASYYLHASLSVFRALPKNPVLDSCEVGNKVNEQDYLRENLMKEPLMLSAMYRQHQTLGHWRPEECSPQFTVGLVTRSPRERLRHWLC